MACFNVLRLRGLAVALPLAVLLASCATPTDQPGASRGAVGGAASDADPGSLNGRLVLTVVDQNGQPISRATVELRSTGKTPYRARSTTTFDGQVDFKGVPQQVELTVNAQYGNYSDSLMVPQGGAPTDARIIVQTYPPDESEADTGSQGGGQGGARGGGGGSRP